MHKVGRTYEEALARNLAAWEKSASSRWETFMSAQKNNMPRHVLNVLLDSYMTAVETVMAYEKAAGISSWDV